MNLSMQQGVMQSRVIAVVEAMPPFPQSVLRLIEMSNNLNCSPKDLVQVIEHDPILAMKVLKMVNSAFFGLSRDVVSIQHALVYLGMNTIKNLAISIASVESLPHKSIAELPIQSFLTHALATAFAAQRLAKDTLKLKNGGDHFIAGLLHGFGKMLLIQLEPVRYTQVLQVSKASERAVVCVEIEQLGVNYAEVGAVLAESWQLPRSLSDCIRSHVDCDTTSSDMSITVAAAAILATRIGLGESGEQPLEAWPDCIVQRLGCDLESMIAKMPTLTEDVQQMQGVLGG
ncbi:MAG: HDOD domain-containing protein [Mariprofundaceae bacterium]